MTVRQELAISIDNDRQDLPDPLTQAKTEYEQAIAHLERDLELMRETALQEKAELMTAVMRRDAALAHKAQALESSELQRTQLRTNVEARFAELTLLTRRLMETEEKLDHASTVAKSLEQELRKLRSGKYYRIGRLITAPGRQLIRLFRKIRSAFRGGSH